MTDEGINVGDTTIFRFTSSSQNEFAVKDEVYKFIKAINC